MPGQIIIVSGPSGAGKSTTCQTFVKRSREMYLLFGIDLLFGSMTPAKFSAFGEHANEGRYYHPFRNVGDQSLTRLSFGPAGWASIVAFHEMIAAAAKSGSNIIVDHLMITDPPILQDCIWRLAGLSVIFVGLKPPLEALVQRIQTREVKIPAALSEALQGDGVRKLARMLQNATPWFYEEDRKVDCYDVTADPTKLLPDEICHLIEDRLAEGAGTAFDDLRRRYPRSAS